jgi:Icc-related predicted phosphoesterase
LVTDSPAHGVLDRAADGAYVGSRNLTNVIDRAGVKAHIHGHIHKCFGRGAVHLRVASGREYRAMWINLDGPNGIEHEAITR